VSETEQFEQVAAHPVFQQKGLDALKEHLTNSIALQQQQQQQQQQKRQ
jgi:hypothetical protein